jgi:hypothetical protein
VHADHEQHTSYLISRSRTGTSSICKAFVRFGDACGDGRLKLVDCRQINFDCGKSLAPLAFVTRLREGYPPHPDGPTRRCGGPMNAGCATKLTQILPRAGAPVWTWNSGTNETCMAENAVQFFSTLRRPGGITESLVATRPRGRSRFPVKQSKQLFVRVSLARDPT